MVSMSQKRHGNQAELKSLNESAYETIEDFIAQVNNCWIQLFSSFYRFTYWCNFS